MKIKKGDKVKVITGDDKGTIGEVLKAFPKEDKVIVISGKEAGSTGKVLKTDTSTGRVYVEGVNMIKKHLKARKQNDPTGIVDREGSIDASNLMLVCPKCGKPTRVAHVVNAHGSKNRVCEVWRCYQQHQEG